MHILAEQKCSCASTVLSVLVNYDTNKNSIMRIWYNYHEVVRSKLTRWSVHWPKRSTDEMLSLEPRRDSSLKPPVWWRQDQILGAPSRGLRYSLNNGSGSLSTRSWSTLTTSPFPFTPSAVLSFTTAAITPLEDSRLLDCSVAWLGSRSLVWSCRNFSSLQLDYFGSQHSLLFTLDGCIQPRCDHGIPSRNI